ncbi:three component ABC system middle component [Pseudosulfitobacter sp. SM2401]|uniref:three component ABC system middle component n=1 Tax=Pseudosulfitobacter sp. SM2401 TaxID=3350098 RepID=UPI0036F398B8
MSYDLYAETNPAFVSFLLYRFVKSYSASTGHDGFERLSDGHDRYPHFSLSYLAIPIAMSGRLEASFSSTRTTTGFLAWLNRFPEIRVGLQRDVGQSKDVTATGLRAALHSQVLNINSDGTLSIGIAPKPPENTKSKLPNDPQKAVARAERLGGWMSKVGGPALIFSALEVNP